MSDLADRVRTMLHAFDPGDSRRIDVLVIAGDVAALEAEVERLTRLCRVSTENHRGLWVALRMVRDAIEEVGPAGILPNIEHEGVEPEQIAEHFVAAISHIAYGKGEGHAR